MDEQGRYTAEEAAQVLQAEGDSEISKRTVNYYAFEKSMFEVSTTGKRCFTDEDLDKLRAIRLLREHTRLTLDQIKVAIRDRSLYEIRASCLARVAETSRVYANHYLAEAEERFPVPAAPLPTASASVSRMAAPEPPSSATNAAKSRTIRVNEDVTLVASPRVTTTSLKKIIDFIRSLE